MDLERFAHFVDDANMVATITSQLMDNLPEDENLLPVIRPYEFLTQFQSTLEEPYRSQLNFGNNWRLISMSHMRTTPGMLITTSWDHKSIFRPKGNAHVLLTEDFVHWVAENRQLPVGNKIELAKILRDNNRNVRFDVPEIITPEDSDKRDAVIKALVKFSNSKPLVFRNLIKEELRLHGFEPENLTKREVSELVENIFGS